MMSIDPNDDVSFWYTTEYMASTSSGSWQTRIASITFGLLADIKVILQGAFDNSSGMMTTNISAEIPLSSPYPEDPATVSTIPNDVVDWILVELRDSPGGEEIVSKSGFLRNDGKILNIDGTDKIRLNVANGDYYIVIKHRNHLPIMSKNAVTLPNSTTYDFTSGSDKYYGEDAAAVKLD
jgi:hypothetical protein